MMRGFIINLENETIKNTDFRRVLYTAEHSQLVLMSIPVGEDIGEEVHKLDQFLRIDQGEALVTLNDVTQKVADGDGIIIPAGTKHNVKNIGSVDLKLYSIYSPAEHKDGTIHKTKQDALDHEEHFDGVTSITE